MVGLQVDDYSYLFDHLILHMGSVLVMRNCQTCKHFRIKDFAFGICMKQQRFVSEMPRMCTDWEDENEDCEQRNTFKTDAGE